MCLSIYLSIYLICLSIYSSIYLICLSIYLSIYLICLSIYLSIYLSQSITHRNTLINVLLNIHTFSSFRNSDLVLFSFLFGSLGKKTMKPETITSSMQAPRQVTRKIQLVTSFQMQRGRSLRFLP